MNAIVHIALCEDETLQREIVTDILKDYKTSRQLNAAIESFPDGKDLIIAYKEGRRYDVFILDVLMPEADGIETARYLRSESDTSSIIFLTAARDYAVESYQVNAFNYLMKPTSSASLFPILDKCISELNSLGKTTVTVVGNGGVFTILASDIDYVCICDRRAQYHLTDGSNVESSILRAPFKSVVKELTDMDQFALCRAALLINISHIKDVNWEEVALFQSGKVLPLPHKAADLLKKALK